MTYRVKAKSGFPRQIFNSDSEIYDGSNVGNYPGANTLGEDHHGQPDSVSLAAAAGRDCFSLENE